MEQALDQRRQAAFQTLLNLQLSLSTYMNALARLAGETDPSAVFDQARLGALPAPAAEFGLSPAHVEAFIALTRFLTEGAASTFQKQAIQEIVLKADPHVQRLVSAMEHLVHLYQLTNRNPLKPKRTWQTSCLTWPTRWIRASPAWQAP